MCETVLNLVLAGLKKEVEHNRKVAAVFLNIQRAFETVNRDRFWLNLIDIVLEELVLNKLFNRKKANDKI